MTRQQAKKLLPIIRAYAKGKTIQKKRSSDTLWKDFDEYSDFCDWYEYRIKPKEKKNGNRN